MRFLGSKYIIIMCMAICVAACGQDSNQADAAAANGYAPSAGGKSAASKGGAPQGDAAAQGDPHGAPQAAEVGIVTIHRQSVSLDVELPGRTSAFQAAEIRPQVNGIVLERLFEEGSLVEAGQQLYQIDPATYKANYNTAVAQLKRAEATVKSVRSLVERYKDLLEYEGVSKQEYDNAVASLAQAEADVAIGKAAKEMAEINLNYTKVLSPISGRIGKSAVTPGALVTANQPQALALVQQLDPIYVDVTQSSSDLMKLKQGIAKGVVVGNAEEASVTLKIDELGQTYAHPGLLKFSDVTVDEATGNVQIRALFPNPDHQLLPGLFVRAIVKQGELKDVLLVPQQAVTRNASGQASAWVVTEDNKAEMRPIVTSHAIKDKWLVTEGLNDGDRVIVEGTIKVRPGMPVMPVEIADKNGNAAQQGGAQQGAQQGGAQQAQDNAAQHGNAAGHAPLQAQDGPAVGQAQDGPAADATGEMAPIDGTEE